MFGEHAWLVVSGYGVVLLVLGVFTAIMGHRRHQDRKWRDREDE